MSLRFSAPWSSHPKTERVRRSCQHNKSQHRRRNGDSNGDQELWRAEVRNAELQSQWESWQSYAQGPNASPKALYFNEQLQVFYRVGQRSAMFVFYLPILWVSDMDNRRDQKTFLQENGQPSENLRFILSRRGRSRCALDGRKKVELWRQIFKCHATQ